MARAQQETRQRQQGAKIRASLEGLRFVVWTLKDADERAMSTAMDDFERDAKGAEVAVFFNAGRGAQIADENHLVGTTFEGSQIAALTERSVTLARARATMTRANPEIGIIIPDACRNNPFKAAGLIARIANNLTLRDGTMVLA